MSKSAEVVDKFLLQNQGFAYTERELKEATKLPKDCLLARLRALRKEGMVQKKVIDGEIYYRWNPDYISQMLKFLRKLLKRDITQVDASTFKISVEYEFDAWRLAVLLNDHGWNFWKKNSPTLYFRKKSLTFIIEWSEDESRSGTG